MPSKSPAQAKLMRAVAHGWKPDRMKGPPRKVAKEFVAADKKAKGMQYGGYLRAIRESKDTRTSEERWREKYGTEPLTLKQASERVGGRKVTRVPTAKRELERAGWSESGGKWYPPQATLTAPSPEGGLAAATEPERTIQPIEGREFISSAAPPRRVGPPARTAAEIAPGFRPGRVPPSLVAYLERARAAAGEPVKMQFGGAMRGRRGRRGFGGRRGQPQPPGGGGLARAAVQPGGGMMTSDMGMRAGQARRGQPGGGGSPIQGFIDRGGIQGRQLRRPGGGGGVGQGQPRPQAPGAGVPLRGVGRPPGMGGPGAGGVATPGRGGGPGDYQSFLQKRAQAAGRGQPPGGGVRAAVMPGRSFMPGGGGAGMPGVAPRIGMGDQQGAQARALQVQTGRPPMSRRQPFPGRGGRRRGRFG